MGLVQIGGEIRSTPLNQNFQYLDGKHLYGDDAAKPSPAQIGRLYVALDTGIIYADIGTAWIPVGGGSVPAHASTHATGGSDPLTPADIGAASQVDFDAHLADIASQEVGKGASLIGSSDSGNYYNSTNVEGQLQEIGARLSTFSNAVIREFTFLHSHQSGERVVRLTGGIAGQVLITKPRISQDTRQFLTALYAVGIFLGLPEIYEVYKINASWDVIPDSSNEGEILFTFPNPSNSANVHLLFIGSGNPVFEMVGD